MLGVPEMENIPSNREKDTDRTGKTKAGPETSKEIPEAAPTSDTEDVPTLKPSAPVLNTEQAYAVRCTSPRIAVKAALEKSAFRIISGDRGVDSSPIQ